MAVVARPYQVDADGPAYPRPLITALSDQRHMLNHAKFVLTLIPFLLTACTASQQGLKPYNQRDAARIMNSGDESAIADLLREVGMVRYEPVYPIEASRRGIEGWAIVEFTIAKDGRTKDIRVVDSHPRKIFDRVSIDAVKKWRFNPRTVDGVAVEVKGETTRLSYDLGPNEVGRGP